MRRCLRRYIEQAQDEVENATEDKVHNATFNIRKLQYIESCGKKYAAWSSRQGTKAGAEEFNTKWMSLCSFCAESPKVSMASQFMWKTYMEVQALAPSGQTKQTNATSQLFFI